MNTNKGDRRQATGVRRQTSGKTNDRKTARPQDHETIIYYDYNPTRNTRRCTSNNRLPAENGMGNGADDPKE